MYSTTTALTAINNMFSDTASMLTVIIPAILLGGIALIGLGFAWRHLKKYITGRKF